MHIIEHSCIGKSKTKPCEDVCVIADGFIAVIDGVTSKSGFLHDGNTTGRLAANIIRDVIEHSHKEIKLVELLNCINSAYAEFAKQFPFLQNNSKRGLQAVCAIYSDFWHEIWIVGDCQVMIDGTIYHNPKHSDTLLSKMRSYIIDCLIAENPSIPIEQHLSAARNAILPWIEKSTYFANNQNSEYGYALINGNPIPQSLIQTIKLDHAPHEIVLASDGYPILERTLALSEARLQSLLESDPSCQSFPSTKALESGNISFDDRSFIRFTI